MFIVFGVMVGSYIQFRGILGIKLLVNADLITLETYVQGKKLTTSFSYIGQNMNKNVNFLLFRGPWGPSMIVLDLSCFPGILWPIATNKEAIWQELLKFKYKKYEKVSFFVYFEGPYDEPRGTKISGQQDLIIEQTYA